MKKINILLFCFILSNGYKAQVGVNTSTPNTSSSLDIVSTNKGISIPKISLASRATTTPITNPKESLLIYNTNTNLVGNEGHYFWNGTSWDFMFNDLNIGNLQNMMKYYSATNTNSYSSSTYNSVTNTIGDTIDSNWTIISNLTQDIVVDRSPNDVTFTFAGMLHSNNTSTGVALLNLGIFVGTDTNAKLLDTKPIYFEMTGNCAYRSFKVIGTTKDLPVGNQRIIFAIKNLSENISGTPRITYGAKDAENSCNNISNDEARLTGVVVLNQPFNF